MRTILLSILFSACLSAQIGPGSSSGFTPVLSDPTGNACTANSVALRTPVGKIYTCVNGFYVLTTSGPGTGTVSSSGCGATLTSSDTVVSGTGPCYAAGGGAAQAQTATFSPAATLTDGFEVCWKPTAANTAAAPTFAPNGLTAHTIVKAGGALVANDILTTALACVIYNSTGTHWELQNPQTGSGVILSQPFTLIDTEIRAMYSSPYGPIIPAQGVGTIPRIVTCFYDYVYGGVSTLAGGGAIAPYFGTSASPPLLVAGGTVATGAVNQAGNTITASASSMATINATTTTNTAVYLSNVTSNFTGGNGGALTVQCLYYVQYGVH